MELSQRVAAINDLVSCSLIVSNAGGVMANSIQLQNQLPDGVVFVGGDGWALNGTLLTGTVSAVAAGSTAVMSFQIKFTRPGFWLNQAQISACTSLDPDSVPGNGYAKGEDDQAQADITTR